MKDLKDILASVDVQRAKRQARQPKQPKRQQMPTERLDAILAQVSRGQKSPSGVPIATPQQLERLALARAQFFSPQSLRGLDIFAGAGGFTIGAMRADCPVIGIEKWERAVQTGQRAGHDVLRMDVSQAAKRRGGLHVDVLIGGPPCQGISPAGERRGDDDLREGFQLALDAIDAWRPTRAVLENVEEFLSSYNEIYRSWVLNGMRKRFKYVGYWLLSAQDYGVPQDRRRVFIWGAEVPLMPPPATHGPGTGHPYRTPRQAGLAHLLDEGLSALAPWAGSVPARSLDEPSHTVLTARNFYAMKKPGMRYRGRGSVPKGSYRILTPEEVQVLQAFPATFGFSGTMKERHRQIGNAVPPPLGAAVTAAVTAGLKPRRTNATDLLDTFQRIDESIFVYEPRPWTDEALIGVTTMKAGAEGRLVTVYDAAKLKDCILMAYRTGLAQERGKSQRSLTEAQSQEAFNDAMGYIWTNRDYEPAAPIAVPVKTLEELQVPIAAMLLLPEERAAVMLKAVRRARVDLDPDEVDEDVVHETILDTISEYNELWEF